jgi:hypothetical protein
MEVGVWATSAVSGIKYQVSRSSYHTQYSIPNTTLATPLDHELQALVQGFSSSSPNPPLIVLGPVLVIFRLFGLLPHQPRWLSRNPEALVTCLSQ